jgi:hypothetical protein
LNVSSGALVFHFSETCDAGSLNITAFMLVNSVTNVTESHHLDLGKVQIVDAKRITVILSRADMDTIKSISNLCSSQQDCAISAGPNAIVDMNGNTLVEGSAESVLVALDYQRPEFKSFVLNLNESTLTLRFSEAMRASSLNMSLFRLQAPESSVSLELTETSSTVTPINSYALVINIGLYDLNRLKNRRQLSDIDSGVLLVVDEGAVNDMNGNPVVASNDVAVQLLVPDAKNPEIKSVNLDLDTGLLTLQFNEIMNISSLKRQLFTLLGREDSTESFALLTN